ncbi:MAG: hypothetical protein QF662_03875, partial [Phycisphaerae bacterium]|nr:hypothetical protein [Phycisphaerae bacterium]
MAKPAMKICAVAIDFEDYDYRTPIKFGGRALVKATLLNVRLRSEVAGVEAEGFGSMPLGNIWSWPSDTLGYDDTLGAMRLHAEKIRHIAAEFAGSGHPVEMACRMEDEWIESGCGAARELGLAEPMPRLCALVTASAFDAALHDAYGKALGKNVYDCYGPEHMDRDLSAYLDDRFANEYLDRYTLRRPKETMPLYHLVGALDPLTADDVKEPVGDGLPETLGEWIRRDGLTHLKIKLNGDNIDWDVDRVAAVDRVAEEVQSERGVEEWFYSLDFNERCKNVEYLLKFLRLVEEKAPLALGRAQYIEQPTARDLKANPENRMHRVAEIKPVVIDESLVDYESLLAARELGYSGVALKACKGQSQALLMA